MFFSEPLSRFLYCNYSIHHYGGILVASKATNHEPMRLWSKANSASFIS